MKTSQWYCRILMCVSALIFLVYIYAFQEERYNIYPANYQYASTKNITSCLELYFFNHTRIIMEVIQLSKEIDIELILLEPKILHCLFEDSEQELLARRGYNKTRYDGSSNIINFGVIGSPSINSKLETLENLATSKIFQTVMLKTERERQWWFNSFTLNDSKDSSHLFMFKKNYLVHIVVFFERKYYLRHMKAQNEQEALPEFINTHIDYILFSKWDSIYEKFNSVCIQDMLIPSNPMEFLHQVPSSKFLECNSNRTKVVNEIDDRHRSRNYKKLRSAFHISLNELKTLLHPLMIDFYIYSGTLLGWYRECDLIPYTTDIDFATSASNVLQESFWKSAFKGNNSLKLIEIMGLPDEAYEFKFLTNYYPVDLFFLYENGTTLWSGGHRPSKGYYFRYTFPNFEICSADLLGYLVHVPCTPEDVLAVEYGTSWMKPIRKWNYEYSPKNTGSRIYWSLEKRRKALQQFF